MVHILKSKATNTLPHRTGDVLIPMVSIVHIFEDNFQPLLTSRPLLELDRAIVFTGVCDHCWPSLTVFIDGGVWFSYCWPKQEQHRLPQFCLQVSPAKNYRCLKCRKYCGKYIGWKQIEICTCKEEIYRIASRITSSCETLSFTHTDGTSSFNL